MSCFLAARNHERLAENKHSAVFVCLRDCQSAICFMFIHPRTIEINLSLQLPQLANDEYRLCEHSAHFSAHFKTLSEYLLCALEKQRLIEFFKQIGSAYECRAYKQQRGVVTGTIEPLNLHTCPAGFFSAPASASDCPRSLFLMRKCFD